MAAPLTTVQFCEMWCPSKRQPHGSVARRRAEDGEQVALGVAVRVAVAADERLLAGVALDLEEHDSRERMASTLAKPLALRPVFSSFTAAARCASVIEK